MSISRKLIIEADSANYDLEFFTEKVEGSNTSRKYIKGAYILQNSVNKNNRMYMAEDVKPAIDKFKTTMIDRNRAGGTLNHEASPDIDLSKLCHKIVELRPDTQNENIYVGKSLILSTPSGKILEHLVEDLSVGMSSRALGRIDESTKGYSVVRDLLYVSVDAVYEPSIGGSLNNPDIGFVKGVLENREYIISDDGQVAESFKKFEKSLAKYPSKYRSDINRHILEGFKVLLKDI